MLCVSLLLALGPDLSLLMVSSYYWQFIWGSALRPELRMTSLRYGRHRLLSGVRGITNPERFELKSHLEVFQIQPVNLCESDLWLQTLRGDCFLLLIKKASDKSFPRSPWRGGFSPRSLWQWGIAFRVPAFCWGSPITQSTLRGPWALLCQLERQKENEIGQAAKPVSL